MVCFPLSDTFALGDKRLVEGKQLPQVFLACPPRMETPLYRQAKGDQDLNSLSGTMSRLRPLSKGLDWPERGS